MAGETPTLEREIRQFWINKKCVDPEIVFTSTACALYPTPGLNINDIKLVYGQFIESWNGSSYTVPSHNAEKNVTHLVKEVIRATITDGQAIGDLDSLSTQMTALGITYESLPVTKAITAETVIPNAGERAQLPEITLQERINHARQTAFAKFVEETHSFESAKRRADLARQQAIQQSIASTPALDIGAIPSAEPVVLPLAIDYQYQNEDPSTADSIIEGLD